MRQLGLGINKINLAKIHKPNLEESLNQYSKYEHTVINTKNGVFKIDLVTIDLNNPNLKIITDAIAPHPNLNSENNPPYGAQSLGDFILDNNGFAGINATYFDTNENKKNYYFFPAYDTNEKILINKNQLKYWTTGPIMAFDKNNKFYYFKDSRFFPYQNYKHSDDSDPVLDFEKYYNVKLQALIGNKPRLVEEKMNFLIEWDIDDKQKNLKTLRNSIGYKNGSSDILDKGKIFLVVAQKATVNDLAEIMKALGVDYALNLDGGNSSALWYNDEYMVTPGRDIPNAIIFAEK